jgi:hypothetical protein
MSSILPRRPLIVLPLAVLSVVVVSHLAGLTASPPGLFGDEAAFGYNGWAIAHHGVDQYGVAWPLFFRSFGDYKGPVGVYSEALLTAFLPLIPFVVRLPNAVAGVALAMVAGGLGWRLTRSRAVALILLLEASFEPWFFHLGRTMLEADLFTPLCYVLALLVLARDGERRLRNCLVAGVSLGVAPFTAQPARFFTLVTVSVLVLSFGGRIRGWRLVALAIPPLVATAVVIASGGQAVARLGMVSVFSGRSVPDAVLFALTNYPQYVGPRLLFISGDSNLLLSSGFGGLLFLTAIPPIVLGVIAAYRRRHEPMARIALLGGLLAPIGPALTTTVSSRRYVVALPFLLILLAFGWEALLPVLRARRWRAAAAVALVVIVASAYYLDYAFVYPVRAARAFEAGQIEAITRAHDIADGHTILLFYGARDPSIQALFALRPQPGLADPLSSVGVRLLTRPDELATAQAGEIIVLQAGDPSPPPGATLLFEESVHGPSSLLDWRESATVLVRVYRAAAQSGIP